LSERQWVNWERAILEWANDLGAIWSERTTVSDMKWAIDSERMIWERYWSERIERERTIVSEWFGSDMEVDWICGRIIGVSDSETPVSVYIYITEYWLSSWNEFCELSSRILDVTLSGRPKWGHIK
jgi:hypothetical protein